MSLKDAQSAVIVAAAVAACTIGVTILLEFVFVVEVSLLLQIAPLSVYFLYTFAHSRLPDGLDRSRNWAGLAVFVSLLVIGYALV